MTTARTLAFRLPLDAFKYGPDKSKTGYRGVDAHSGQKYVIFNAEVAQHIINSPEGSREYLVQQPKEAGWDWVVEGIPGVVENKPKGGPGGGRFGGGGGGGGMTNKQVALLAAATLVAPSGAQGGAAVDMTVACAERLLAYLAGGATTPAQPTAPAAPTATVAQPTANPGWAAPATVPDDPAAAAGAFIEGIGGEGWA